MKGSELNSELVREKKLLKDEGVVDIILLSCPNGTCIYDCTI